MLASRSSLLAGARMLGPRRSLATERKRGLAMRIVVFSAKVVGYSALAGCVGVGLTAWKINSTWNRIGATVAFDEAELRKIHARQDAHRETDTNLTEEDWQTVAKLTKVPFAIMWASLMLAGMDLNDSEMLKASVLIKPEMTEMIKEAQASVDSGGRPSLAVCWCALTGTWIDWIVLPEELDLEAVNAGAALKLSEAFPNDEARQARMAAGLRGFLDVLYLSQHLDQDQGQEPGVMMLSTTSFLRACLLGLPTVKALVALSDNKTAIHEDIEGAHCGQLFECLDPLETGRVSWGAVLAWTNLLLAVAAIKDAEGLMRVDVDDASEYQSPPYPTKGTRAVAVGTNDGRLPQRRGADEMVATWAQASSASAGQYGLALSEFQLLAPELLADWATLFA